MERSTVTPRPLPREAYYPARRAENAAGRTGGTA